MDVSREDRVRMESAHVQAWPALKTAVVNQWLWPSSGGGSQRANSVSTIDFNTNDLDAAIDAVEARYRGLAQPARFHIFDDTAPPRLADASHARGYKESAPTVTMFRRNAAAANLDDTGWRDVEHRDHPCAEWQDVYLDAITENRRAVNAHLLYTIPGPRAFFGCRRGGRIISTAL